MLYWPIIARTTQKMPIDALHQITPKSVKLAAAFLVVWCPSSQLDANDCAASGAEHSIPAVVEQGSDARPQRSLDQWIDALEFAESGNREWIVHRDRDGRDYYGCLQFRDTTFRYYVAKFDLAPNTDPAEMMSLLYDCAFQKRLAARMLHADAENWKHWKGTTKRIGLPPLKNAAPHAIARDQSSHDCGKPGIQR